jgi:hypothetical protein
VTNSFRRLEPTNVDVVWTDTPKATTWTNWLYVRYPMKKGNRTINFSRYGGLGNHRTPTGFSGDTLRKWDTLEYEIYMTPRASNVGFGWWSHVRKLRPSISAGTSDCSSIRYFHHPNILIMPATTLVLLRILAGFPVESWTTTGTQSPQSSFCGGCNSVL